ncbi:DUF433 domain-containing protein [Candidatus Aerophobetes bacterium]|nr:DUF433 domain-containing protein [Candidatus Aerophobetes bacterium]
MKKEEKFLERISSDPDICHGKPCIKGTRIPVYLIVSLVSEGMSAEEIINDYSSLTVEDIKLLFSTQQNSVNMRLTQYENSVFVGREYSLCFHKVSGEKGIFGQPSQKNRKGRD